MNGKQRTDFYGAAYTLKIAGREYKATAGYNRASFTAMTTNMETKSAVTWLGATTQLGANGTLKFMGARLNDKSARNLDATQFSVGYDHKLSKRTTVYSAYSKINNKNGAFYTFNTATLTGQDVDAGFSPRAFNFGIRHAF
jgi:predicted porin